MSNAAAISGGTTRASAGAPQGLEGEELVDILDRDEPRLPRVQGRHLPAQDSPDLSGPGLNAP